MLSLYNTLTKKKEVFQSLYTGKVGMYSCGPTVYGKIHIGNMRAYLLADLLRRYFEYTGFEVRAIMNITDVGHLTNDDTAQGDSGEDKLIRQALAEKKTPQEIARGYETYFHETQKKLNMLPAHYYPRATGHISQMIAMIQTLIGKGHAYEKNGNVFLDVTTFPHYGSLSGNTLENLKVGARLEEHPDKKNPWDFALWLKAPAHHLMHWPSPWSEGYPGWHIECSAMSMEYLGDSFDIHTGGEDNIFPHHEAEIVQSEGVSNKPFVRYWVHTRHLLADGVKMSKSKGNLYTYEDIIDRGYSAMDLRFFLLSSHYRSQMNFTWTALDQAKRNWETLQNTYARLQHAVSLAKHASSPSTKSSQHNAIDVQKTKLEFNDALEDDLNTPQCITKLLELSKEINSTLDTGTFDDETQVLETYTELIDVLGLHWTSSQAIPEHIQKLAQDREIARASKDFTKADALRDELAAQGYAVEDRAQSMRIVRK